MLKVMKGVWLLCCVLTVMACSSVTQPEDRANQQGAPAAAEADSDSTPDKQEDPLAYNLARLSDPDYTDTYGGEEHPKVWYSAAEALGEMGKVAVPHLIERLQSEDEYEVMLALYALQLASQDATLMAQTDGNYISLPSVLNPRANAHNKAIALDWWQRYAHLWSSHDV